MLHLLLGTDWVSVKEEILHRVAQDVREAKPGRILMVPELISHDTERRLCAAAGDTASRFAEVLSFTRLARRISDSGRVSSGECMDAGGRLVAMTAAVRQLHSKLKAYAAVETKPEFLTGLLDAVDEFKRCCITPGDLAHAAGQTEGAFAQKLEELSLILEAYDGVCAQGKRDPRDLMNWLLEQLEDGEFGENHVFYIEGFPDFTRQHLAILEHLIRVSPAVTVGLNCDSVHSQRMAFEKASQTAQELCKCAQRAGVEVKIEIVPTRETDLAAVRNSLFQGAMPQDVEKGRVKVFQAESAFHEVQVVAEKILDLVHDGCRYRDIAVVCTDMGAYQNLIRLWFGRCHIPVYLSGTENMLGSTVVMAVVSAMDAALGDMEKSEVLHYLRSCVSPLTQQECDLVENYALLWDIQGKRWLQDWENHPGGLGENWTPEASAQLSQLNQLRKLSVTPLAQLRQALGDAANLGQQVDGLFAFLENVNLAGKLDTMAFQLEEDGQYREAQILNQLWEILLSALEQLKDVLGQSVWDKEAFSKLVSLLLSQYDVGTIPPVLDSVTVGSVSAMRCQQEKHLFVLGAQEGALPGYGGSAGILTDQERVALRSIGLPLTGGALEGLQAEFAEVYGVFCGAKESVTVSCPGTQPSFVYRRLEKMAGGEENLPPVWGAAAVDAREAGICLTRWNAASQAKAMALDGHYERAKQQIGYTLDGVKPEHIPDLYGETLRLSASQVDQLAQCRMAYFLKYGLRAKERKEATVDPAEFGTFVHAVLEHTAREVMALGGFREVSLEQTMEIASAYADSYTRERFSQLDSQRIGYLFRRNRQELDLVVKELWQELKASEFAPVGFEVAFGDGGDLPAIQVSGKVMPAVLRGFVDRVDLWEQNGKHYFRVVDYKTGKKDFDYCDVFNGIGLQMLLYLFAIEQSQYLGETPVGAGVQYFPARVPVLSADGRLSREQADALRLKEWKRKGLLLENDAVLQAMDPEDSGRLCCARKKDGTLSGDFASAQQMRMLKGYLFRILGEMVDDIASGNVTPNPYTRGTAHNACTYCPYDSICHQATVEGRRNYQAMSAQRFWQEMEREERHG